MVERADIEAKAREIEQTLMETREGIKEKGVLLAVAVVAVVAVAFLVGRRRGAKRSALVKIYRV